MRLELGESQSQPRGEEAAWSVDTCSILSRVGIPYTTYGIRIGLAWEMGTKGKLWDSQRPTPGIVLTSSPPPLHNHFNKQKIETGKGQKEIERKKIGFLPLERNGICHRGTQEKQERQPRRGGRKTECDKGEGEGRGGEEEDGGGGYLGETPPPKSNHNSLVV